MGVSKDKWMIVGGAGYIGSHVARAFLAGGEDVVVFDDLSTGYRERVPDSVPFVNGNAHDSDMLADALMDYEATGLVLVAGLKQARESARDPIRYWSWNLRITTSVAAAIQKAGIRKLIHNSSCSVYGNASDVVETSPFSPMSPYAQTHVVGEEIVRDVTRQLGLSSAILRYFNVVGNDDSPMSHDTSLECLVPAVTRRLLKNESPVIFGTDFPTVDGTALRDYVDVRDIAAAHLAVAQALNGNLTDQPRIYNVGTGKPTSVLTVVRAVADALGTRHDYLDEGRSEGDPAAVWASTSAITADLHWRPNFSLEDSVVAHTSSVRRHNQASREGGS